MFTVVPLEKANWIGSLITVQVDHVIQNSTALALTDGQRISFIDDGEGSATINGVRVETETPWLWPIERGRYVISARVIKDRFVATGMWNEPNPGGTIRGRFHDADETSSDPPRSDARYRFHGEWNINQATFELEREITKRRQQR